MIKPLLYAISAAVAVSILSACHTGIESTAVIKMSKTDRRETLPTEEELLAAGFMSAPLGLWQTGKRFLIADDKASLILESEDRGASDIAGHAISYVGTELTPGPGSHKVCRLVFEDAVTGGRLYYNTGRQAEAASQEITGLDIPALIDLDLVAQVDSVLRGRRLWIKSDLWYDKDGNIFNGSKFMPVRVERVNPGNMFFPVAVEFSAPDGNTYKVWMNVKATSGIGAESRTFPTLFSLTDPKLRYPSISEENWKLIQEGRVALGMTKDECKLSLGNPPEVDSGHDWNNTIDVWRYKDGTFLHFQDGLLVNFRK